jgi:hypothetical protein
MSNNLFAAAALGTVLFLYGIAGHFDAQDEESLAQTMQAPQPAPEQLLRLVCSPERASWPQSAPDVPAPKHTLILASDRPANHVKADAAVAMRCFIIDE